MSSERGVAHSLCSESTSGQRKGLAHLLGILRCTLTHFLSLSTLPLAVVIESRQGCSQLQLIWRPHFAQKATRYRTRGSVASAVSRGTLPSLALLSFSPSPSLFLSSLSVLDQETYSCPQTSPLCCQLHCGLILADERDRQGPA